MAELMIGGSLKALKPKAEGQFRETRLSVEALSAPGDPPFGTSLKDVAFSVRSGEILGIAGVAGNGQNELLEVLSGEKLNGVSGAITIGGARVEREGVSARRRQGLATVPEERNGTRRCRRCRSPRMPSSRRAPARG